MTVVTVPQDNEFSLDLKREAAAFIAAGPPVLDRSTEERWRYGITALLDDLRDPRSGDELLGTGAALYERLADYHLRRQGLWSAHGKAIPRALRQAGVEFCTHYSDSFQRLFQAADPKAVLQLGEEILRPNGGLLFDGYKADAPESWRIRK